MGFDELLEILLPASRPDYFQAGILSQESLDGLGELLVVFHQDQSDGIVL